MREPIVTVLLPVFNGEKFLAQAIDSILAQTFRDFEFLIIDDASTDNSRKVIESCPDPRIRFVKNETNLQLISTLNKGLSLARGAFVARMDQDDLSYPSRLEKQLAFLESNPSVGIVGTGLQIIDKHGAKKEALFFPKGHCALLFALCFNNSLGHPSVMVRRDVYQRLGGYSQIPEAWHCEDYELWKRALWITRLANLPEILLDLRKHETNVTKLNSDSTVRNAALIGDQILSGLIGREVVFNRALLPVKYGGGGGLRVREVIHTLGSLVRTLRSTWPLLVDDHCWIRIAAGEKVLGLEHLATSLEETIQLYLCALKFNPRLLKTLFLRIFS